MISLAEVLVSFVTFVLEYFTTFLLDLLFPEDDEEA